MAWPGSMTARSSRGRISAGLGLVLGLLLAALMLTGCSDDSRGEAPARAPGPSRALAQVSPVQPEQAPREREPVAGVECYIMAQRTLQLADTTAFELCVAASSAAPAQCFAAARERSMLVDPQIVDLCRCADSTAPVACVERGRSELLLTDGQLVDMCSAVVTQQLRRSNCAALSTK